MFFTEVKIDRHPGWVAHDRKIWAIGSCFADEIGKRMANALFDIRVNPLGTLYNPLSIATQLTRIANGDKYSENDLFTHNGLWHCMHFHSAFSGTVATEVLARINSVITTLHSELPTLQLLMVTFGSARAFIDHTTGRVVANCHKLPAARFEVRDIRADETAATFSAAVASLRKIAPRLKIIYTVSPIRHKAYGFHADRISKANLLIAADTLCGSDSDAAYFPAYEIMNDELRDYRFYASDMIHPSEVAADHIYRRFLHSHCNDATITLADECTRFTRRLSHRMLNPGSDEAAKFACDTETEAAKLVRNNPHLAEALDLYIRNHNF